MEKQFNQSVNILVYQPQLCNQKTRIRIIIIKIRERSDAVRTVEALSCLTRFNYHEPFLFYTRYISASDFTRISLMALSQQMHCSTLFANKKGFCNGGNIARLRLDAFQLLLESITILLLCFSGFYCLNSQKRYKFNFHPV